MGESPRRPAVRLQQSRQCGIRSVASCPNKQFLATCGANPNHLAIYRLPDFQPFALGMVSLSDSKLLFVTSDIESDIIIDIATSQSHLD